VRHTGGTSTAIFNVELNKIGGLYLFLLASKKPVGYLSVYSIV
jgi:hypothetical protein